jgi:hypothetical protein
MSSIFDLKTSVNELSSANDGISKMMYEQIAASRDITGASFSNGPQHFRWEVSGQKWLIPARSYFRARWQLKNHASGLGINLSDNIAPNMAFMSNLYQSAEVRMADKTVSRISDFMSQIEALEGRLTKSKGWLNSVGKATNFWDSKQSVRRSQASLDGKTQDGDQLPYEVVAVQANLEVPAPATTTIAYTAATGLITFAGAGAVNTDLNFKVGDYLVLTSGNAGLNVKLEVVDVPAGVLTMTVRAELSANIAAAVITFNRVRVVSLESSRRSPFFECIWQPPLSFFKIEHAIPCSKGEVVFNPQTSSEFQRRAIESTLGAASKVVGVDFDLELVDMYWYACTVEGPRCDDITYLLDLETTRCQTEVILTGGSFQQKTFDVSPSTHALTVAYQDTRVGTNTAISATKFKSYEAGNVPVSPQELRLNRLFVNYAGLNKPSPDADPSFIAGTDFTVERYAQTQIGSGAYFDTGGAETLEEYHERGSYYYFPWQRDGTDRSTRCTVNQGFTNGTDVTNMRVLLFDHSKQVARVKVSQGRIVDLMLEDA